MRLYHSNVLHVIFLVPIAIYASQNGGCSSTPEPGPLTAEQTTETIAGNTVQLKGEEIYAFVAEDGMMRGKDLPHGGSVGTWKVSDNGVLCAQWTDVDGSPENCDTLRYVGEADFLWGGNLLQIIEGNPQNL